MSSRVTITFEPAHAHAPPPPPSPLEDDSPIEATSNPSSTSPSTSPSSPSPPLDADASAHLDALLSSAAAGRLADVQSLTSRFPHLALLAHPFSGRTALMESAAHNRIRVALHLLDRCGAGRTAQLRDAAGSTAGHLAAQNGHGGMVVWLWKRVGDALLRMEDAEGATVEARCDARTLGAIKGAVAQRLLTPGLRRGGTGLVTSWDAIARLHDAAKDNSPRQISLVLDTIDTIAGKKEVCFFKFFIFFYFF